MGAHDTIWCHWALKSYCQFPLRGWHLSAICLLVDRGLKLQLVCMELSWFLLCAMLAAQGKQVYRVFSLICPTCTASLDRLLWKTPRVKIRMASETNAQHGTTIKTDCFLEQEFPFSKTTRNTFHLVFLHSRWRLAKSVHWPWSLDTFAYL